MIEFAIEPLVGVGPIRLGSNRAQVHAILGEPVAPPPGGREMYFDGFFVDYDETGHVEFIELARSDLYRATLLGIALHEVPAERAIALVSGLDSYDPNDPEPEYSFIFLRLQLSLWRGTLPESGQSTDDPDGRHFEAIGVARPGYFIAAQPSQ